MLPVERGMKKRYLAQQMYETISSKMKNTSVSSHMIEIDQQIP